MFVGNNTVRAQDQPFSESLSAGVVLNAHRPNAEILIDLGPKIATNETSGLVSNLLVNAGASLTSLIRVQGVPRETA